MALNDTKNTLFRDHLGAVGSWRCLALIRWYFVNALVLRSAGAKRSKNMWHAPDTVLVGHENVVFLPGESIRFVQILDMAIDPGGFAGSVIAQEREIASALLSNQNVAVGQDEPDGSPLFTLLPLVACWRYRTPGAPQTARVVAACDFAFPSDRVGYSDHVRFRGYIPVHFIPAYNLPVYASQRPLPDATQDLVRGCSLGFAAAVISDG